VTAAADRPLATAGWPRRAGRALRQAVLVGASGPSVALLFSRCFALVTVMAWASLAVQVRLLIGERGLLPLRPLLVALRATGDLPLLGYPSLLRWPGLAGDSVLLAGTLLGVLLGLVAFFGWRPRLCFALSTALYLSYATACRSFLAFQWDNLLLECGLLAALLPTGRPAPLVHLLLRLVAFKLYFESGLAKWQSGIGDWNDGSAMTFYYQTSPLPAWLGYFAHHLPAAWHHFESWLVLGGELLVPFALFGPRRARLGAAGLFTLFQLANLATANYGFFCYLALALHLLALDERDADRALAFLRARLGRRVGQTWLPPPPPAPAPASAATNTGPPPRWSPARLALVTFVVVHISISTLEGLDRFGPRGSWQEALLPLERIYAPLRLVNTYHLFASVTRERVEPEIELLTDGQWQPQHLRYKPGPLDRRPPFVAPHQPRVDFLLWFHGLSWQRRPEYLANLMAHLCHDRGAVAALFARPLPPRPQAVRLTYHDYSFTPVARWRATGHWWQRAFRGTTAAVSCDR
jgi:lipase maturation factor 1